MRGRWPGAYRRPGLDVDDLEQEAALALVEAAKKFEPEKNPGVPFVAFARPFLVRRLGVIACPEALASLPHDLPAPSDPAAESRGNRVVVGARGPSRSGTGDPHSPVRPDRTAAGGARGSV